MEKSTAATAPPQPPPAEHIDALAIRIDLERFVDRLQVRLRPRLVAPSAGPRVAIELDAAAAASLGRALLRHAGALGVPHG